MRQVVPVQQDPAAVCAVRTPALFLTEVLTHARRLGRRGGLREVYRTCAVELLEPFVDNAVVCSLEHRLGERPTSRIILE